MNEILRIAVIALAAIFVAKFLAMKIPALGFLRGV